MACPCRAIAETSCLQLKDLSPLIAGKQLFVTVGLTVIAEGCHRSNMLQALLMIE
jgi:hypothetical protein